MNIFEIILWSLISGIQDDTAYPYSTKPELSTTTVLDIDPFSLFPDWSLQDILCFLAVCRLCGSKFHIIHTYDHNELQWNPFIIPFIIPYLSYYVVFFAVTDVFLLFTIKCREHGSGDTIKGLDCWLLECIQLPEWGLWHGSLCKAELNGIMDWNDRDKQKVFKVDRRLLLYVITINNAPSPLI